VVYHIEILLLFVTLVALGPLVRRTTAHNETAAENTLENTMGLGLAGSLK
jgi:hypothetical protein